MFFTKDDNPSKEKSPEIFYDRAPATAYGTETISNQQSKKVARNWISVPVWCMLGIIFLALQVSFFLSFISIVTLPDGDTLEPGVLIFLSWLLVTMLAVYRCYLHIKNGRRLL